MNRRGKQILLGHSRHFGLGQFVTVGDEAVMSDG
jgi:hypothetical protein